MFLGWEVWKLICTGNLHQWRS